MWSLSPIRPDPPPPKPGLAGVFWRHHMALILVCRPGYWYNRHCKTSPVDLNKFWGQVWTLKKCGRRGLMHFKTTLEINLRPQPN